MSPEQTFQKTTLLIETSERGEKFEISRFEANNREQRRESVFILGAKCVWDKHK